MPTPGDFKFTIPATYDVKTQDIVDLIVTMIETPMGSWLQAAHRGSTIEPTESPWYSCVDYWQKGGKMTLDVENPDNGRCKIVENISLVPHVRDALSKMAMQAPHQFKDLISDNMDAETADVFGQFLAYGEIIYG